MVNIFQWRGRTSKTAFRDRFRTALQERLPDAAIQEIGELDLCIERPPGGMKHKVWLGRAYQEFTWFGRVEARLMIEELAIGG